MSEPETLEDVAGQIGPHVTEGRRSCRNRRSPWTISPGLEGISPAREKSQPPPKQPRTAQPAAAIAPAPPPKIPAVARMISDYDGLVEALRDRVDELGCTREELDHLSGLQAGYHGKLLTRRHVKVFGKLSLGSTLATIGCKLLLVEDTAQTEKIRVRMKARQRPIRTCQPEPAAIKAPTE